VSYVLLACQLILASILILAAGGKMLRADEFMAAIRLSYLPRSVVFPIAIGVPTIEFLLAVALLVSSAQSLVVAFLSTAGLFIAFTAWMSQVVLRGLRLQCGCFGGNSPEIGPHTILRNAMLTAIAIVGTLLAWNVSSPLPAPSFWLLTIVLSGALGLTFVQSLRLGIPAMVLSGNSLLGGQSTQED
jgi:methylamine utilization protein MauE